MKGKIPPAVVATVIAVLVLLLGAVGYKVLSGDSPAKAVIVKPDNPNDPKFTEHLPAGLSGTSTAGTKD